MKGTILCVDDERMVLDSLKAQLRRRFSGRFRFETAESTIEAREILDDLTDSGELVVISDWLMPGERGDAFLADVSRRFPKAVLILLTGQADREAIERARRDAALEDCLGKPWAEEVLSEAIQNALTRRTG